MWIGLRFTSIATLLIGLQVLLFTIFQAKLQIDIFNDISANKTFIASQDNGVQALAQMAQTNSDFKPQDNGGPDYTRGSGTR